LTEITCDIFVCVVGVWQRDFLGKKNHAVKHRLRTQNYHQ